MNFTHTKHRNRLAVKKIGILCFVYINRKILDRDKAEFAALIKRRLEDLTIEEAIKMETIILKKEIRVDIEALRALIR